MTEAWQDLPHRRMALLKTLSSFFSAVAYFSFLTRRLLLSSGVICGSSFFTEIKQQSKKHKSPDLIGREISWSLFIFVKAASLQWFLPACSFFLSEWKCDFTAPVLKNSRQILIWWPERNSATMCVRERESSTKTRCEEREGRETQRPPDLRTRPTGQSQRRLLLHHIPLKNLFLY